MFAWLHKKQARKPVHTPLASRLTYDKILAYFGYLGELDALCQHAQRDEPCIDWQTIQISLEDIRSYLNQFMDTAQ